MNSADKTFPEMQDAVREVVRLNSGVLVAQGVIMTLLGIAAAVSNRRSKSRWPILAKTRKPSKGVSL
jgi:hypothetical protein